MIKKEVILKNKTGLHARPAAILVQTANDFKSDIYLEKDNERVNAKSIMGVMMLAAAEGSRIKIVAEGSDEKEAVEKIAELLQSNLDRDENLEKKEKSGNENLDMKEKNDVKNGIKRHENAKKGS